MTNHVHDLVRQFFAAMSTGQVPEAFTTPDMAAWTLSGGASDKARFAGGVGMMRALFRDGFTYEVGDVIADGDRAAAEVRGSGVFIDGTPFENRYVFMLALRDGRIAGVREYADVELVRQHIVPRIQAMMAARQG